MKNQIMNGSYPGVSAITEEIRKGVIKAMSGLIFELSERIDNE